MSKRKVYAFMTTCLLIAQQIVFPYGSIAHAAYNGDPTVTTTALTAVASSYDDATPPVSVIEDNTSNTQPLVSAASTDRSTDWPSIPAFSERLRESGESFPFNDIPPESPAYQPVLYLWEYRLLPETTVPSFGAEEPLRLRELAETAALVYRLLHDIEPADSTEDPIQQITAYGLLPDGVSEKPFVDNQTMLIVLNRLGVPVEPIREVDSIAGTSFENPYYDELLNLYRAGVFHRSGSILYATATRSDFACALAALLEPSFRSSDPIEIVSSSDLSITPENLAPPDEPDSSDSSESSAPPDGPDSSDSSESSAPPNGPDSSDSSEPSAPPDASNSSESSASSDVPTTPENPTPPPRPKDPFIDVDKNSSTYEGINTVYEMGLLNGVTENTFQPKKPITAAQLLTMAVRVYETYYDLSTDFTSAPGGLWYQKYIDKAAEYNLLFPDLKEYTKPLTRQQALYTLYRIYPSFELQEKREVFRLPDVSPVDPQLEEILVLYRAGITNGTDPYGTLKGDALVTREEAAMLIYRLLIPEARSSHAIQLLTGMQTFQEIPTTVAFPFQDVDNTALYAASVKTLYYLGLIRGATETSFQPDKPMSLAEALTLGVKISEYYHGRTDSSRAVNVFPWYTNNVELAKKYGIAKSTWSDFEEPVSREQFAYIVYRSLPDKEVFPKINNIKWDAIPDVDKSNAYYDQILLLYNVGILSGEAKTGTFHPKETVSKAMAAVAFARLIHPDTRIQFTVEPNIRKLQELVTNAIASYSGKWSVYFCNVDSGSDFVVNDWRMWSASVVKLYVMAAVMDAIEKGELTDSEDIQSDLQEMITVSSNSAWNRLYKQLGNGNTSAGQTKVNEYCRTHDYPNSGHLFLFPPYNTTSAKDTGLFLLRVLRGENVSQAASQKMLSFLKAQERTGKIPAGVPFGVPTANKTGELYGNVPVDNDAAIVFSPAGSYILVVLTERGSVLDIRKLSTLVYNYFTAP